MQPFDTSKFNFTKALQKEVLFQFEAANMPSKGSAFLPLAPVSGSPNLVFINVSPIEYGHVLLVPRALDRLNQLVCPETLKLALQFAHEAANPYFRLAFNSLGAYGTVNHLHFQVHENILAPFFCGTWLCLCLSLLTRCNQGAYKENFLFMCHAGLSCFIA